MSTKKSFVEIVTLLQNNPNKKVSDILDEVMKLTVSKKTQSVLRFNDKKELTHIFCWYHKEWEDISKVEYGKKASTETGLNTFCKVGVNQWTKQQSTAKEAKGDLLMDVAEGKVKSADITKMITKIELERQKIYPYVAPKKNDK